EIEVNFKAKTDISPSSGYTLHPAFNFGGENLSGIWVGKFEVAGTINSLIIKPNANILSNQSISFFFTASRNLQDKGNSYGFSSLSGNLHVSKNMEWGAAAYLTQSKYGKYGNPNYTGVNKEVYINNYNKYMTGCSSGTVNVADSNKCLYTYEIENMGTGASTTGTIYGIYDMSGGTYEYVMGVLNRNNTNANFSIFPEEKYYDNYTTSTGLKGDATNADNTKNWYNDDNNFIFIEQPWFVRGSASHNNSKAGVFSYAVAFGYGYANNMVSSRFVITP
ncbi:MAG: hypothetical protein RSA48_02065, partial [Bacilli bacterium]